MASESKEPEKCIICTDEISEAGLIECCEHTFCFTCIEHWSKMTNCCPICKKRFNSLTKKTGTSTLSPLHVPDLDQKFEYTEEDLFRDFRDEIDFFDNEAEEDERNESSIENEADEYVQEGIEFYDMDLFCDHEKSFFDNPEGQIADFFRSQTSESENDSSQSDAWDFYQENSEEPNSLDDFIVPDEEVEDDFWLSKNPSSYAKKNTDQIRRTSSDREKERSGRKRKILLSDSEDLPENTFNSHRYLQARVGHTVCGSKRKIDRFSNFLPLRADKKRKLSVRFIPS
eukprot:TRINITY_DN8062_c0_g1_i1.p1 TRINITY_DN8062_c0_g1~~TRINITY_DN8062_c0_g1_i1.p1  ORF type:complete len:293 (-),score=58.17 TRINITY_DN8062_c0_g1_i1:76-933(-)